MLKNIAVSIILVILALVFLRGLTGEDTWICQGGEWVAHGKPSAPEPKTQCPGAKITKEETMKLTSAVFSENEMIPQSFSCDGKNIHPPFTVSDIPIEAKSLAMIVEDPDAPSGTFTHWVIWNIPVSAGVIAEGVTPTGAIEGTNSAHKTGYTGPCPPGGTHHYVFTVFALDGMMTLTQAADKTRLEAAMAGHILTQTKLTGLYHR